MRVFSTKTVLILLTVVFIGTLLFADDIVDRCVVPEKIRQPILHEVSGELALRHVEMLSINRDRQAEEYTGRFFETDYLVRKAEQYGLSDVKVDYFPRGEIWDGVEASLMMVKPYEKRFADLNVIPAAVIGGSADSDVEAEVVFVGSGRASDFKGRNVAGKIVLTSTSVNRIFSTAVNKYGAAGVLGTGSAGINAGYSGSSLDQIGWTQLRGNIKKGFAFMLSKRQYDELKRYLDYGREVVMKAHVKSKKYPYKMNVISAEIPGSDPAAGELIMVAHAFEYIQSPGANDNCTGVATTLETGRTLAKLINNGTLPQPKRTIRFLWVPEISGSSAFMYKYPELENKLIAAMNFDMTGENLKLTDSYLRMKMTPDSRPSYLNDLIASLLQFVDQTDIRTQTGNNGPFNYRLVPFISSSDHVVFLNAGIPAMQFNHWTDNFYHSSFDRAKNSDPTEMKRVAVMAAAGFYYMATAGEKEACDLAWECLANGEKWMSEVIRQSVRLLVDDPAKIHEGYKAARIKIDGAFGRAAGTLQSLFDLSKAASVHKTVEEYTKTLEEYREVCYGQLDKTYRMKCGKLNVKTAKIRLTAEEKEIAKLVPRKKFNYYTDDYRNAARNVRKNIPSGSPRIRNYLAMSEIPNFVNGKRSILDICYAVRAEYGNVNTSSSEFKYAYMVSPEYPDIPMHAVKDYIFAMEKAGLVVIGKK